MVFKDGIIMYLEGACVEAGVGMTQLITGRGISCSLLSENTVLQLCSCCPSFKDLSSVLSSPTPCLSALETRVLRISTSAVLTTSFFLVVFIVC